MREINGFEPKKDYLICVDSDGCVFDNMELKHKECFCPATVNVWELQGVSRYVRESFEFVNLYSRTRGINRFPAIVRTLELAYEREEVKERGYEKPDLTPLLTWMERTPSLSGTALESYVQQNQVEPLLNQAARWSREVDANIAHIVRNVPPFPHARRALEQLQSQADVVIVSATPHEAIEREWNEHGIAGYVNLILGQEYGTKEDNLRKLMGKYDSQKIIMIGDAPGDHDAAAVNNIAFYPIIPGQEQRSWKRLCDEVIDYFFQGTYQSYSEKYLQEFYDVLLVDPPWVK